MTWTAEDDRALTSRVLERLRREDIALHVEWNPDAWCLLEHLSRRTGSHHEGAPLDLAAELLHVWPPWWVHALLHDEIRLRRRLRSVALEDG